jgi:hypothetical protein
MRGSASGLGRRWCGCGGWCRWQTVRVEDEVDIVGGGVALGAMARHCFGIAGRGGRDCGWGQKRG